MKWDLGRYRYVFILQTHIDAILLSMFWTETSMFLDYRRDLLDSVHVTCAVIVTIFRRRIDVCRPFRRGPPSTSRRRLRSSHRRCRRRRRHSHVRPSEEHGAPPGPP